MNLQGTYHLHPAMQLLRRSIRREFYWKLALVAVLFTAGIGFGYVFFEKRNVLATFGLVATVFGLKLLRDILLQPRPEDDPLWQLLHTANGQQQIVWVYCLTTQVMPFGFHLWERGTMFFKLLNGDEMTVGLPAGKQKMVSRFLNRLLPHASFGYSEERRIQFEANPALLRRKNTPS